MYGVRFNEREFLKYSRIKIMEKAEEFQVETMEL